MSTARRISKNFASLLLSNVLSQALILWTVVLVLFRSVLENGLIASDHENRYFIGFALSGIITIIANIMLVPKFRLIGASVSGIFSEGFLFTFFLLSTKYVRPAHFFSATWKPLVAAGLMGALLAILPANLFVLLVIGTVSYGMLLYVLRAFTVREVLSVANAIFK